MPEIPDALCDALVASLSQNQQQRVDAEKYLSQIQNRQGTLPTLMQLVTANEHPETTRLLGTVLLKNSIKNYWDCSNSEDTQNEISAEDKTIVRNGIFELLVSVYTCSQIRNVVDQCIKIIVQSDYPKKWPEILETIKQNLSQRDITRVHCALLCLHKLTYKYEMVMGSERTLLDNILKETSPAMIELAKELVSKGVFMNLDSSNVAKMLLKNYWCSTQVIVDGDDNCHLNEWMKLVEKVIMESVPTDVYAQVTTKNDLGEIAQFKTKKWAYQVAHRSLSRVQYVKLGDDDKSAENTTFMKQWAPKFMKLLMEIMLNATKDSDAFLMTEAMMGLAMQYVTLCLQTAPLYAELKPRLKAFVEEVCIPLIEYNKEDQEMWEVDPIEYVQRHLDLSRSVSKGRTASCEFCEVAGRFRARDTLPIFSDIVMAIMNKYSGASAEEKQKLGQKKYAGLIVIGCIAERLTGRRRQMDFKEFLATNVICELQQVTNKFVTCASIWTLEKFLKTRRHSDLSLMLEDTAKVYHLLSQLQNNDIPIRAQCASCMKYIISSDDPVLRDAVKQSIPQLMESIIQVLQLIDSDTTVLTLQEILTCYEEQIPPYATGLLKTLSEIALKVTTQSQEDEEKWISSMTLLDTIISVLYCLKSCPNMYNSLDVTELLNYVLSPQMTELLEEGLKILSFFVKYPEPIKDTLWTHFEQLYVSVCGMPKMNNDESETEAWAWEQLPLIIPIVELFMKKDPETFYNKSGKCGIRYKEMPIRMAAKTITEGGDLSALQMLHRVLDQCCSREGMVDDMMTESANLIINHIRSNRGKETLADKSCRQLILQIFSLTILYNPTLHFQNLTQANVMDDVAKLWTDEIKEIKNVTIKREFIMAFVKLMSLEAMGSTEIPLSISRVLPLFGAFIGSNIKEAVTPVKKPDLETSSIGDDSSADSEQELDDSQDAVIEKKQKTLLQKLADGEFDEEDDDDDDSYTEQVEEFEEDKVISNIDGVDIVSYIKNITHSFNEEQNKRFLKNIDSKYIPDLQAVLG